MPEYVYDPVETDHDTLEREALEYIQSRWPDWEPNENSLVSWLISACTRIIADARDIASDVPRAIFRYWGTVVLGLPPVDPTPATVDTTWTLVSNPAGRTILGGTWVVIDGLDGTPLTFEVVGDTFLPAGTLVTADPPISLVAVEEGAHTDGLGGPGEEIQPLDPISWVDTITMNAATNGGQDGEDDDDYLDRLSARLTLLTPRPILPRDFVLLARDLASQNGVEARFVALDGFNPADSTTNNERMIALAGIDTDTAANLSAPLKLIIDAALQAMREVNFVVNLIDPTRTDVDVTFAGVVAPGYDPAEVEARAEAAAAEFLNPLVWGNPGGSEQQGWDNQTTIRHQDLSTVLNNVEGFSHWTSLTIGLNGGAQTATDRALTGAAPLVEPGVISGSVIA